MAKDTLSLDVQVDLLSRAYSVILESEHADEHSELLAELASAISQLEAGGAVLACSDSVECRDRGCADCERSYGPKVGR